jgi:hypothetical protein
LGERRGEGSQLTYTAANDELRLVGKDGRDAVFADGEGRGVKGPSLTLRRAEDTILVDGLDVQRTSMTIKRGPKKP